jgi:hypothetical protein
LAVQLIAILALKADLPFPCVGTACLWLNRHPLCFSLRVPYVVSNKEEKWRSWPSFFRNQRLCELSLMGSDKLRSSEHISAVRLLRHYPQPFVRYPKMHFLAFHLFVQCIQSASYIWTYKSRKPRELSDCIHLGFLPLTIRRRLL